MLYIYRLKRVQLQRRKDGLVGVASHDYGPQFKPDEAHFCHLLCHPAPHCVKDHQPNKPQKDQECQMELGDLPWDEGSQFVLQVQRFPRSNRIRFVTSTS